MEDRSQIWIKIQAWFARAGRATKSGLKRFWAWLPGTLSLTRQHAAQAWALLRQEKLKPVVVVWALSVLPALLFALSRAQDYRIALERIMSGEGMMGFMNMMTSSPRLSMRTVVLEWLLRYVCAPILYAMLARLFLARLRHAPVPVLTVASEKAKGFKSLLYLALACMLITQMVWYVAGLAAGLLGMLLSLITWMPGLGTTLLWVVYALGACATCFVHSALLIAMFSLFLAAEDMPGQVFPSIIAAWAFLRNHTRSLFGLCVGLTVVRVVLLSIMTQTLPMQVVGEVLAALLIPLAATAYIAALYAEAGGPSTGDPFAAPDNIDTIKRAN